VPVSVDARGLDHLFTFFAMATRRTMFEGVQSLLPGHYLKVAFRRDSRRAHVTEHRYWDFDFPAAGEEEDPADAEKLIDEFEATFRRAVEISSARRRAGRRLSERRRRFGLRARDRVSAARQAPPELHNSGPRQGARRDG
jgi:hypothetical protein